MSTLILKERREQRFELDGFEALNQARAAVRAELDELANALTLLDHIEKQLEPARGLS